ISTAVTARAVRNFPIIGTSLLFLRLCKNPVKLRSTNYPRRPGEGRHPSSRPSRAFKQWLYLTDSGRLVQPRDGPRFSPGGRDRRRWRNSFTGSLAQLLIAPNVFRAPGAEDVVDHDGQVRSPGRGACCFAAV